MKHLFSSCAMIFLISGYLGAQGDVPFVTEWRTSTPNETITIPINPSYSYNYDIDWGDGNIVKGVTSSMTHSYTIPGIHTIIITGQFPALYINNAGDKDKIVSIEQWGNIKWQSMNAAFYGASNMEYNASDNPDLFGVTDLSLMFREAADFNGNIGGWNVSKVTNFAGMFRSATSFNQAIGSWVMSAAEKTSTMFFNAKKFNQDISQWGPYLSNVDDMNFMFYLAEDFDQDISSWDISEVSNMTSMLLDCGLSISHYDKLLYHWARQAVQTGVTLGAGGLNYCISDEARDTLTTVYNWDITDAGSDCSESRPFVTTWRTTFANQQITIPTNPNYTYNYNIDWDGDGVYDSLNVTGDATHSYTVAGDHHIAIDGDFPAIYINNFAGSNRIINIDQWGDIEWASMENAFSGASNISSDAYDLPDLRHVNSLHEMFSRCTQFNQDIGDWNVSGVEIMSGMFSHAENFNQDIGDWDVSSVENMREMFFLARTFNQPIGHWGDKVAGVTDMSFMFEGVDSFNQDISMWDVSAVENMSYMFSGATSFNQPIGMWAEKVGNVTNMEGMFGGADNFNQDLSMWDVNSVGNMADMFGGAVDFNQDISDWEVGTVTNMGSMFSGADNFNQDISEWDVSGVDNIRGMFRNAISFNQDIGDWNIEGVSNMEDMLNESGISQLNYDSILIKWSSQNLMSDVELGVQGLEYCNGQAARLILTNTHNWDITGDSFNCVNAQPCASTQINTWTGPAIGLWNDATNWSLDQVPSPCDDVIIPDGYTVTLSNNAECYTLDIADGSTVEFSYYELIVWRL